MGPNVSMIGHDPQPPLVRSPPQLVGKAGAAAGLGLALVLISAALRAAPLEEPVGESDAHFNFGAVIDFTDDHHLSFRPGVGSPGRTCSRIRSLSADFRAGRTPSPCSSASQPNALRCVREPD